MPILDPPRPATVLRSRMPMRPAWIAFPVGLAALAAGTGMVLAWYFEVVGRSREMPSWILAWMGLVFAGAGLLVLRRAATDVAFVRRASSAAMRWQSDHPWNPVAAGDGSRATLAYHLCGAALLAGLLVPMNLALLAAVDLREDLGRLAWSLWLPVLVVGLFDLLLVALVFSVIRRTLQLLRYGPSRFVYGSDPPFRPGGTVEGTLRLPTTVAEAGRCEVTLRCVRERILGSGKHRRHEATAHFEEAATVPVLADGSARVRFEIPDDAPGTDFSGPVIWYWEALVRADMPGVDFDAVFLLPLYAEKPASGGA